MKGIPGFGIKELRAVLAKCGVSTVTVCDKLVVEERTCHCCGHKSTSRDIKPVEEKYHIYNDGVVGGRSFKLDRKQLTHAEVTLVLTELGTMFDNVEIVQVPWTIHRPGHTGCSTRIIVRNPSAEA